MEKEIIEFKRKCLESNIDLSNVLYCPAMPVVMRMERTFMLEEFAGIKVARLISAPND